MTVVIDVGCARYHGSNYSIERLVAEFAPDILYGFDPLADLDTTPKEIDGTLVDVRRQAAWTHDGYVGFAEMGLSSHVQPISPSAIPVPCINLPVFIHNLVGERDIVLKIDAEGSEYPLLTALIESRYDRLLKLAWVEWHPPPDWWNGRYRAQLERDLECEVREWEW